MLTIENGSLPLYIQVKNLLLAKISKGEWAPASMIPSETQLSQQLGVSHGTIRKAIDSLVESNLLIRRQGRGTFVASHNPDRSLFHFYRITDNQGIKALPESLVLQVRRQKASRFVAGRLNLEAAAKVFRIERVRSFADTPLIVESIYLPESLFAGLDKFTNKHLPNSLYEYYEKQFGITIHVAEEELRAVAANRNDGKILRLAQGSPLLEVQRLALTIDRDPVELRISRCHTKDYFYQNTCI